MLAHAAPDQRDLRIVTEDRQLPFLLERTSISRSVPLASVSANHPKKPRLARWLLKLPQVRRADHANSMRGGFCALPARRASVQEVADERIAFVLEHAGGMTTLLG